MNNIPGVIWFPEMDDRLLNRPSENIKAIRKIAEAAPTLEMYSSVKREPENQIGAAALGLRLLRRGRFLNASRALRLWAQNLRGQKRYGIIRCPPGARGRMQISLIKR